MLNALFAPAPPAAQASTKSPVVQAASANEESASDDFAQLLDHASAKPPCGPASTSGNEPAKAGPAQEEVKGKDRSTVPPEAEDEAEDEAEAGAKNAAADPATPQNVAALLAELRAAAPAAHGAARRGGDVTDATTATAATAATAATTAGRDAAAAGPLGARAATGALRADGRGTGHQDGHAESQRDSFAPQLSAASAQSGSALHGDSLPAGFTPVVNAALTAPATAMAPAGLPAGLSSSLQAEAHLPATPGSAQFGTQLGAQISTFVQGGVEHARLHLNPADMGPVSVQIQLDGQTARVHLSAENALTRQALEQALPLLASSLREAGLTLSGGGVFEQARQRGGAQSGEDAGNDADRDADRDAGNGNPRNSADDNLHTARSASPARRRGVVDLVA